MFRGRTIYYIAAAAIIILSGCVAPPAGVTPTPTATPMPTPTPTPGTSVEVLSAPSSAEAGKSFEVTWRVNSPVQKNITHTAVHYGNESKSEPLTLQSYPSLTTPQSGTIPNEFRASITINAAGVTYFRAHAIVGGINYWSSERMITISAPVNVTAAATPTVTPTVRATTPSGYGY